MVSTKKKCIVSAIAVASTDYCQIYFDDNRFTDKTVSSAGCFQNIEKCSDFIKNITSLIPVDEIKALVMSFPVALSIKNIQMVKEKIKELCEKNQIFYAFPPQLGLTHLGMLCAAKPTNIKDGENIILISLALNFVDVQVYKHKQKEYFPVDGFKVSLTFDMSSMTIKQEIVKNFKPKKIIIMKASVKFFCAKSLGRINEALSKYDTTILGKDLTSFFQSGSQILINHLMGEKESEFFIKFFSDRDIYIPSLLQCGASDHLPLEKSVIYKVKKDDYITLMEPDFGEIQYVDLSEYVFQQVQITLKIDENYFYDLKVEPIAKKTEQKVQISGPKAKLLFTQNDYMIFAWKNGKKKLIKDSTESTKIPFCISFANEIPKVGEKALEDLKEKPKFVVYDLLKLCQLNILKNIDPKWPFKVIQDSDNTEQAVIQFETFRGPRETSVDFLLGMILKSSKILIEKEMGIKVEEFGIEFESVFDGQESIKQCLEKAAERIKIKVTFL